MNFPMIKRAALLLMATAFVLNLTACSSTPKKAVEPVTQKQAAQKSEQIPISKIDNTIKELNEQIREIQDLEMKAYSKSLTGDKALIKELKRKQNEYGTIETLEANLKVLAELKTDQSNL